MGAANEPWQYLTSLQVDDMKMFDDIVDDASFRNVFNQSSPIQIDCCLEQVSLTNVKVKLMPTFEDQSPWTNTYYLDGVHLYQDEREHRPLEIGHGFIDARQNSRRFRVQDIWISTDSHGRFDIGRHIFLTEVSGTEDDLPGKIAPDYFAE